MFNQTHLNRIRDTLLREIPDILEEKSELLEEEYKKNPYIKDAKVEFDDDVIDIKLDLSFEPKDDEQNIPAVFEYGGIIYDTKDNLIEIQAGYYIRKIIAGGRVRQ
tara:strand:+ start:127 stop:444 length:318 start_codon:yes stop_codon:yes gene_type:complete